MMSLASSGAARAIVRFVVCQVLFPSVGFGLSLRAPPYCARLPHPVSLRAPCGACTQVELYEPSTHTRRIGSSA